MLTYATQERGKVARTYAQRMRRLGGHVTDFLKEKARRYLGATREVVRIDMTRNAGSSLLLYCSFFFDVFRKYIKKSCL